ncbi:HlyD family type I secretion periplasmic adaptor subunit [Ensifer adhaerens]|uniref:HlyD family type I secretion periplasmic adaptor subunit n=1 Tax=Ensifer adhaerens TaxID=106592 RepID=UPI001CBDDBB3|nr:HlyD family type I secretion periplasmic adaptor subunit [Ensifer adhaerens]MBZ7924709.1 HlyD family type I secretion periplasmic adaptor subunit [Ensifer adhaerens]UAX96064.1 HlyD family type I secretion periplasmic adaptor subunit [Ensifer adhaerens]UAY04595.1 HlyD family type I secretion periplasmic adaptor subunit [Ensifer adhaerens]UAY10026.1 HlyD family type I secretion periplasmic adaptor subunit [Ensifer adhaerens]
MTDAAKVQELTWYAEVPRSIWQHTLIGFVLIGVTFGGFGAWAVTAPLAAAIIAQGSFVATGQNKVIQHFEGGIIKEILVSEGDHVTADQPLIRLDETAAQANERQFFLRRARLEAIVARLNAQAHGLKEIALPEAITEHLKDDPEIRPIVQSQQLNFQTWRSKLDSDIGLLKRNIESLEFRSEGFQEQLKAVREQRALLDEEYAGKKVLLAKDLIRKTEIKTIQRAIADAEGQIGRLMSEVSETGAQILKQEQQVNQTEESYKEAALDELQKAEAELDTVREQLRGATNVLRRATINAPVTGTVIRMHYHTSGGVIESGKPIMEILPADVPLIIEAQVLRTEIDNIKVGEKATVRLTALNQRTTPVLNGQVFYLSADALPVQTQDGTREVYLARVSLPASELARVHNFAVTPGMPAEILIQTAERTFFDYLTKPIRDSMARAFMEN